MSSTWRQLKAHPEQWESYFIREKAYHAIREFFAEQKFHEIDTPLLIAHPPAESYLDVFATTLYDRQRHPTIGYLSTSPEVPLKKLLVAGLGDCYTLTKSFRNMETQNKTHNPEFTILEWYRIGVDYFAIMADCEDLFRFMYQRIHGEKPFVYQGKTIDIASAWERVSMKEAFAQYAHVDFDIFLDEKEARRISQQKGYQVQEENTWEELYNQIFLNEVEPYLGQGRPTILYEFPAAMGALAKKKATDPRYAERFEFYIAGLELGDCYSELTDAVEQEARFKQELLEIKRLGKTLYEYDHDFIDALHEGLPACSGIAIGVDRLIMLLADVDDIHQTLLFPGKELFA